MPDISTQMKARLREDLKAAMKSGRPNHVKLLRTLMSAIDQAEAQPPAQDSHYIERDFMSGDAEVARRTLTAGEVAEIIAREAEERESAAREYDRLAMTDKAQELRNQAELVRRYLG